MITIEELKNDKKSFDASINTVNDKLEDLKTRYDEIFKSLSSYLRSSSSLIESCNNILELNKIKLTKNIEDYELNDIILLSDELSDKASFELKDRILTDVMKICTRKRAIIELDDKRKLLVKELYSAFNIREKDLDDELVITNVLDQLEEKDLELTREFSQAFQTELEEEIKKEENNELNPDLLNDSIDFDQEIIVEEKKGNSDTMIYKMEDGVSFIDLVTSIYKDASFWENLYLAGNNKETIDEKLEGKKLEDYLFDKNILTGLIIEIPNPLIVYDEIEKRL